MHRSSPEIFCLVLGPKTIFAVLNNIFEKLLDRNGPNLRDHCVRSPVGDPINVWLGARRFTVELN